MYMGSEMIYILLTHIDTPLQITQHLNKVGWKETVLKGFLTGARSVLRHVSEYTGQEEGKTT